MVYAGDYQGKNDHEIITRAIKGRGPDGIVVIPPKKGGEEWILDEAVLLPENTTVILQNCRIRLSDSCRDNFFRSANCGMGIADPPKIENIHIRGEGRCVLQGADHPRASGDGSKKLACPCPFLDEDLLKYAGWLSEESKKNRKPTFAEKHDYSYGTDAGKAGESQFGDWRGIGILFANVEFFSIENICIRESHGWGISLEACSQGTVRGIEFRANMSKMVDGMLMNMENQDGIDLRNGCHNIVISDVTGETGDDVLALTAIKDEPFLPGGSLCSTRVMPNDWTKRESGIHDIIIRNIIGKSSLCATVRLLSVETKIWNVVIDGVIDLSPEKKTWTTIVLGEPDGNYGKNLPDGLENISISNVICSSGRAIEISGYLKDSVISNVINRNPAVPILKTSRPDSINNVQTANLLTVSEERQK